MFMCPVCRKTICNSCKHEGALKPGQCANKKPCAPEVQAAKPPKK